MGRPAGSPNKRSTLLLKKLEKEHNFDLLKKIIKLYQDTEDIYTPLFAKVANLMTRGVPLQAMVVEGVVIGEGLSPMEMEMFNSTRKDLWTMLAKLLGYSYPKLKGIEVNTGDGEKITFNINIPKTGNRDIDISQVRLQNEDEEENQSIH